MTFSLCNLLFLASTEDGSGQGCKSAAWMEMAEQSISLAWRMWRGENDKRALTFFSFCVAVLPRSRSVTDKSSGIGVRRHCTKPVRVFCFSTVGGI